MTTRPRTPVTRAVRASIASDPQHGAVVPPIHLSSTFAFEGFNRPRTYDYTRSGNPTRSQLADALAELECGAGAVVTSTGMSAVTLVLQLLRPGDTIVAAHDCYGGTQRLLRALAARSHFTLRLVNLTEPRALTEVAATRPRIVWIETPSNPLLRITDIRAVARVAHEAGALVVVDNTFLSPALQQPLTLGADLVVHSTTKYLNGHSDVVGGAVVAADRALADELIWWANCLGITGAPFDSFLTLRGVRTLHSRMRDHLAGAAAVVQALRGHPAVERIYYPGLAEHQGHDIARTQQSGFGAMVSFELRGGTAAVERLAARLTCFTLAESLGGVESLIAHPATMTHASMSAEARSAAGISDSLVRLSVGIESPEDLVDDLLAALGPQLSADSPRLSADSPRLSAESVPSSVGNPRPRAESREPSTSVVLLGVGAIGRELIAQVSGQDAVRVCGIVDRSGFLFDPEGLSPERLEQALRAKAGGDGLASIAGRGATPPESLQQITRRALQRPVLVDATPADTTPLLELSLARGFDLVLANKVPLTGTQDAVDRLRDVAERGKRRILHEATVGAGLPVLDTLRKLRESGDEIVAIEGCPSGTLGFLFAELGRGERFSAALRRAVELGYTEPDPRVDLSGLDVARKALILARAIGFRGELSDVKVESLVPVSWSALSRDLFVERVEELDGTWANRVNDARRKGRVLRYRAHVTPTSIVVGLVPVKLTDALGVLEGTDNQFTFTTKRYRSQPLTIRGPGAGAAVTAAGVLNDVLSLG